MKNLLIVTAVLEAATGLALLVLPSLTASLLLGAPLDLPGALAVARVAGAALLTLALACWLSVNTGRALVISMLFYNIASVAVLAHAALGLGLSGPGLWPAAGLHAALAAWCLASLSGRRAHLKDASSQTTRPDNN
ncbi:MAG: hypothetical protein H7067_13940 [Burkholderiales bacterium]|nr:hypothetical protein [Opitutaceae bacterium]